MAPFLISLILFAIFNSTRSWGDLVFALGIGVIAVFMKRFDYSRVALMIGFVLSDGIETNLYQTIQFYTFSELFVRPIFIVLIIIAFLSVYSGMKVINKSKEIQGDQKKPFTFDIRPQWIFVILMFFISIGTFLATKNLEFLGSIYPVSVSIIMFLMSIIIIIQMLTADQYSSILFDTEQTLSKQKDTRPFWQPIIWFVSPLFLSVIVGFYISIGLFVIIFLTKIAKIRFQKSLIGGLGVWFVLALISHFMVMDFPPGILQSYIELPWPIN
ncbi:hypothetical protein OAL69_01265 [Pelagibacteraceae bacterium]|nr:hypothetical protein [Pelagibacteraceae bacterium]